MRGSLGDIAHVGATLPSGSDGQAFLWEGVLTFFLMFVIMAVATDTRAVGEAAAIAIGGTVGLDAMFGGPITGASMNPARSLGPAIAASDYTAIWVYIAAPLLGAARRRDRVPVLARRGSATRSGRARSRAGGGMSHVLFVCIQNAGRSQIAEALFTRAASDRGWARAGRQPASRARSPRSRRRDAGARHRRSRHVRIGSTTRTCCWADVVVTMGCGDECPFIPGKRYIDWELDDPAGQPVERVREVRDEIRRRVEGLIGELAELEPTG